MNTFKDFVFTIDKNRVLNAVNSYYRIDDFNSAGAIFDNLQDRLKEAAGPVGIYCMEKRPEKYSFETIKNCRNIIFCLITLGKDITEAIEEYFADGKFMDGIILDAMASALLFEYNTQMYNRIYDWAEYNGMGITCRIAPGDGEIPFEFQEDIVDRLSLAKEYGIEIIKGCAISPAKSMSYIHGADESIERVKRAHDCKSCGSLNCCMRDVKEKVRKPFKG